MIKETLDYLQQAKAFLAVVSPSDYSQPIPLMSNSTIGIHTRHFIECYQCLVEQFEEGQICYADRKRDKMMEENPKYALFVLQEIMAKLPKLAVNKWLFLKSDIGEQLLIKTTAERELLHNLEHTIHHLAIIKIGLSLLESKLKLPENFGVAPATIQHWQHIDT